MFYSKSSSFEKDLTVTNVYDLEDQVGESAFEFVQALDEFDLEQSCLLRLKAQRQKIEELTKLYQQQEKELLLRSEREKKLQDQIDRLSCMSDIKQSYAELKIEYDSLVKRELETAEEFESLRRQFDEAIAVAEEGQERLLGEIKFQKEQRVLSDAHWDGIVADREEELKKQTRDAQEKETELNDKLNRVEEELKSVYEAMNEKGTELQQTSFTLKGQLKCKEEEIANYDKLVQCMRRQISDFKTRLVSAENEWQKQKEELSEIIEQLRLQVKLLRKDQSEKENQIYQFKEMIRKCDKENQNLEETVSSLKTNLKKSKENMDTSIKKLATSTEQQKGRLQMFVQELKSQLENEMEEKSTLALEVKRLRGVIERKDQQERQRKLLLMSEFREIDKLEKVVKKIL